MVTLVNRKNDQLFIRLHENMPEHPKIERLSDKAFRLLVQTWCWCARTRTDGHVSGMLWSRRGTASARAELLAAGLVDDDLTGGVIVHDWDKWQRTSAEIEQFSRTQSEAGEFGAHQRWHVRRRIFEPECRFCKADGDAIAGAPDEP